MRHGNIENRVLEMLRNGNKTFTELYAPIYGVYTISKEKALQRTLRKLKENKLIKKEKKHFIFLKDYEVIGTLKRNGPNHLKVNIPKVNKTQNWKVGDKVVIERIK